MGVWIETSADAPETTVEASHPAWVCGLKHDAFIAGEAVEMSHPAWVCGLKLLKSASMSSWIGHTLRGCVD